MKQKTKTKPKTEKPKKQKKLKKLTKKDLEQFKGGSRIHPPLE